MAEAMDSSTEVDLPAWAQPLKNAYVRDNFVHGFVSEQAQLELVLELQGRASLTEYVRSHKDDFEKRHEGRMEASRLLWKYGSIPASDCPFIVVSSQELQCQYGMPRKYTKDGKPDKSEGDHAYARKHRLHLQKGRKVGCTATGIVKELLKFPSHTVGIDAKRSERERVLSDLKNPMDHMAPRYIGPPWTTWLLGRPPPDCMAHRQSPYGPAVICSPPWPSCLPPPPPPHTRTLTHCHCSMDIYTPVLFSIP